MQKLEICTCPKFRPLLDRIPETIAVMGIDKDGKLITKCVSKSFESEFDSSELEYISRLIGLRYKIANFHKILEGLKMTVNVFRDHCIFVTSLADGSVIAIVTKNVDIEKTRQIVSHIDLDFVNIAEILNL